MAGKELKLTVAEAYQDDIGRAVVRLSENSLRKLNLSSGDIIEITGGKSTAAIVWQGHPQDEDFDLIRMDGLIRQNSDSSLRDKVIVKKAKVANAKTVTIAPVAEIRFNEDFVRYMKQRFEGRPLTIGDNIVVGVFRQSINFIVSSMDPKGIVRMTSSTELNVLRKPVKVDISEASGIRYEDIGGLKNEISKVREMIELPLKHPELFEKLGIAPPKGVLLYGPPGTGKTLLAKAVANETQAHFSSIAGPEIMDKYYGESEKKLREIFEDAQKNVPAIIFIDEIDSIAPKREETRGEVERRIVAQLLTLMDGLETRGNVIVIAATNREDSIDPALRRPGRFDREIEIGVPDKEGRIEVLQIHTRNMPKTDDVDIAEIASSTHGFVGADLAALAREAAMSTLKRVLPEIDLETEEIPSEVLEKLIVQKSDFIEAMKSVEPSALREVFVEVPTTKWENIGGLDNVKNELKEAVEWPIKYPGVFKKMGIRPPKGVLLYGPPGCGKTLLAKAAANESEANFILVKGPELISKWVGESEKGVREIFKKARQTAPTMIFFDEIDSIAPRRDSSSGGSHVTERVVNQILTEIDGVESLDNVIIIGATNRQDMLDPALLRPGRFDSLILVPPPDGKARLEILKVHTRDMPIKDVNLKKIAKMTSGYSGADIEGVCREAGMIALRDDISAGSVTEEHFEKALKKVSASFSKIDYEKYREYDEKKSNKKNSIPAYG
ncbi:MAG: AAA family ATPase [Candidatus Altiarchaeales archaeon HGW-Altiarchaeales-3]|nr:MAG: AAA family ATPase [Candidatus Altiarchaeales archaeon HGW-Altiarchaeales-3]